MTGGRVELTGLHRSFGAVRALDDFSLELAPGELVALLGPSGCGKTTALRALAGLEDIDAGSIKVDGVEIADAPANKRDMAMVFQSYSLFPHMTAAENIAFALELRGVAKAGRGKRVDRYLELVGLGAQRDRYAHQLSGGQQQRVALARALSTQPQVLLLDEPLSALDAKVRVQLRDEIRRIQSEVGTTALFVTHDQEEALAIADRVGVMRAGRLEQIGSPRDIYDQPVNDFVADFIGLTNRLPARLWGGAIQALGQRVEVLPGSKAEPSAVLVRPEHIRLVRDDADPVGTVALVGFLGSQVRVQVRLDDGELVIVQTGVAEASGLVVGDRVRLELASVPALAV